MSLDYLTEMVHVTPLCTTCFVVTTLLSFKKVLVGCFGNTYIFIYQTGPWIFLSIIFASCLHVFYKYITQVICKQEIFNTQENAAQYNEILSLLSE